MAQLVRRALDAVALDILERTLASGIATESELAIVQQELEYEAASPTLSLGMRASRALLDHILEAVQTGEISRDDLWSQVGITASAPGAPISTRLLEAVRFALLCGNLPSERARLLRSNNELITISQLPPHERLPALREFTARAKKRAGTSFALTESYFGGSTMYTRYLEDELSICARAVVCHSSGGRRAFSGWQTSNSPQNLKELTTTYLKSVPLDPYSGQPLRLVHKGPAFIIYSIGPDQKDDGGALGKIGSKISGTGGPDQGFVIFDLDHRRRPGPPFVFPELGDTDVKRQESAGSQK